MENQTKPYLCQELEVLFHKVPPKQLLKSIHELFYRYLQTINDETDMEHFKRLAEDCYYLHQFLERVEKEINTL